MRPVSCFPAFVLVVSVLAFPVSVFAHPSIRKCVGPGGRTTYQSMPCSDGTTQAWSRDLPSAVPETPLPPASDARRPAQTTRRPVPSSRATPRSPSETRASACDAAKARRADIRDRQWRSIRFDQLRELDDEVARACRH